MMRIKFYATISTFQKEKCVSLSALSVLSFAGGWPGHSTFHLGTIGMATKGAPSTILYFILFQTASFKLFF